MPYRLWLALCWIGRFCGLNARRELRELYLFSLLFSFAFSLITIFEPIFFYQQGFSLSKIALYYALHYTLYIVVMPFGGKFAARFGLERSLAVSMPLFVVYFLSLAAMPWHPDLFWVAILLLTLHKIFYWPSFHADFAKFSDSHNRGTEQSWMRVIMYGMGIAGPLCGGIVTTLFGFPTLFIIAACTVLVAGLPLLRTKEQFRVVSIPYNAAWQIIRQPQHRRMVWAMLGWAEDLLFLVFWPIWMYLILGSTERLGVVAAISTAIMALWGLYIGELIDKQSPRWVLRWAAPLLAVVNALRVFANTPVRVFALDVLSRTTNIHVGIPFVAQLYTNAKRTSVLRYALAFETVLAVAKAATAWGLVWLFATVPAIVGFKIVFWLGAAFSLLYGVL